MPPPMPLPAMRPPIGLPEAIALMPCGPPAALTRPLTPGPRVETASLSDTEPPASMVSMSGPAESHRFEAAPAIATPAGPIGPSGTPTVEAICPAPLTALRPPKTRSPRPRQPSCGGSTTASTPSRKVCAPPTMEFRPEPRNWPTGPSFPRKPVTPLTSGESSTERAASLIPFQRVLMPVTSKMVSMALLMPSPRSRKKSPMASRMPPPEPPPSAPPVAEASSCSSACCSSVRLFSMSRSELLRNRLEMRPVKSSRKESASGPIHSTLVTVCCRRSLSSPSACPPRTT